MDDIAILMTSQSGFEHGRGILVKGSSSGDFLDHEAQNEDSHFRVALHTLHHGLTNADPAITVRK